MDTSFDLNRLRLLAALDETRSVGRAADLLNMSQSGFSTALGKLRQEFGDQLFVRTVNGMEPTPRGALMARTARQVLQDVASGVLAPPQFDPAQSGTEFRFAMADVSEVSFLPRLLSHLQAHAPGVTVRCTSLAQEPLESQLAAGNIDLAIGYFPDLDEGTYFTNALYEHSYACLLRESHPSRQALTVEAYQAMGHVVSGSPVRANGLLEERLLELGIPRRVVLRTPHHLSIPAIVESTDLAASLPLATAQRFATMARLCVVPLPFETPTFPIRQYWHRLMQNDPRHRWLREQIRLLFSAGSR